MGSAIVSKTVDTDAVCAPPGPLAAVSLNLYLAPCSMAPAGISRWNGLSLTPAAAVPPLKVVATPEAETWENTDYEL